MNHNNKESKMKKPNIILILTDHFRRDTLGPATPNLMKIAANSTLLEINSFTVDS